MTAAEPAAPRPEPRDPPRFAEAPGLERYRERLLHEWAKTLSLLGVSLIPLFTALDYFTMPPELLRRFGEYRFAGTVFALLQHFVVRHTRPTRVSYLHGYVFSLIVGGMIVRMTVDLGGFDSSYYAGLILVVIAVNLVLPWQAAHSAVNGALLVGSYLAANLAWGGPFHLPVFINNVYFLVATVVITVAISFLKHRLIEQEFRARTELMEVNESLDRSRGELKTARDALWSEMVVAKRIQTALLPPNRTLGGYELAATMQPADEVGGDYYDIIESRAGEHWVAIGDVSGHGVESGLAMMMTQTSILTLVNDVAGRTPAQVFRAVNFAIRENIGRMESGRYMTLNVIRLFPDRMTVAGKHQDILVHRAATGRVEALSNGGSWVGLLADTEGVVGDTDVSLEEGDTVLLFTDGVTEAASTSGELFGQERLERALAASAPLPLREALSSVVSAVQDFQSRQEDDLTVVMLRRRAQGAASPAELLRAAAETGRSPPAR